MRFPDGRIGYGLPVREGVLRSYPENIRVRKHVRLFHS